MAITLSVANKNTRADALVDLVDAGTTNTYGQLWLKDVSSNVLSKHDMSDPAFGDAASGVAVADSISSEDGLLSGACTKFSVVDKDETEIFAGTVTAVGGGGDLESDTSSTQVTAGENVDITSLTYVEGG